MKSTLFRRETTGWSLEFAPQTARLTCRHAGTGALVRGTLAFAEIAEGKETSWSFALARDGVLDRLALVTPEGNVNGYLVVGGSPDRLEVTVIHRAFLSHRGRLTLTGTAQVGRATFACCVTPRPASPVVQMASGPADSALNDALFDAQADTLLRFAGESVRITTEAMGRRTHATESPVLRGCAGRLPVADPPRRTGDRGRVPAPPTYLPVGNRSCGQPLDGSGGRPPRFHVRLTARPEQAAEATLVFEISERFYRSRYVPGYRPLNRKRCPTAPTGWMSWNVYFDRAGEKETLAEAEIGARLLRPFGLEIWSIESWQANSDRQPVRDFHHLTQVAHAQKFPHGMRRLAEQLRELGFKPGIWVAPFGTGSQEFYEAHRSWFLHDTAGQPMQNWCGLYLLDPSQPAVRRYLRATHELMSRDWGYEFFKIDGMSAQSPHYSAHFYERDEVRAAFRYRCEKPLEACVKALRAGIGADRIMLACAGHYTGPEAAFADAARIGGDIVHPHEAPQWRGLVNQARVTLQQLFVHNLVWYNDPDTLLVGTARERDAARIATTVVALPGQVMFSGDKLGELPADRIRLIQRALPVCDVQPLDLYPVFELKPIWDLKVARPFAAWDVVALFNWTDEPAVAEFAFADLGLDGAGRYLAFEFWAEAFLGEFSGRFRAPLAPRSSLLLALQPLTGRPQFLSTDRHITQGGTCLRDLLWDADHGRLEGTSELVAGHPQTLFFHVPQEFAFVSAGAVGADVQQATMKGERLLAVTLTGRAAGAVTWQLQFA
jgi:hypothetical protein